MKNHAKTKKRKPPKTKDLQTVYDTYFIPQSGAAKELDDTATMTAPSVLPCYSQGVTTYGIHDRRVLVS